MPSFIKIEHTAAFDDRLSPEERDEMFSVIKWVYRNVDSELDGHAKTWSEDLEYYTLLFKGVRKTVSAAAHLSQLVWDFSERVRDVVAVFSDCGMTGAIDLAIEVYRPSAARPLEFPKHAPAANRKELFFNKATSLLEGKRAASVALPKTWKSDARVMDAICKLMNNKSHEDLKIRLEVLGDDRGATGQYFLEFEGEKSVSYSFLEEVSEASGSKILDVFLTAEGLMKRTVTFAVGQSGGGAPLFKRGEVADGKKRKRR